MTGCWTAAVNGSISSPSAPGTASPPLDGGSVSSITDINERTGRMGLMVITIYVITYRNQFDQVVATQTNTSIRY